MKALLETDESPAAVLYRSCMAPIKPQDADTVLGPWLDIVDTVVDNSTFVEAVIAINNADLSFLWTWYVDTDAWNKQRHAFTISQSHTSLDADLVAAINEDPTDTDAVADLDAQVGRRPKTYPSVRTRPSGERRRRRRRRRFCPPRHHLPRCDGVAQPAMLHYAEHRLLCARAIGMRSCARLSVLSS
jgi:hypothetical protein